MSLDLGQHFLTNDNIAKKIADSLTDEGYNNILEIGISDHSYLLPVFNMRRKNS